MPLDTLPATRLDAESPHPHAGCGSHWAVAQTHPQAERWALANLTRQGYETYLPLIAVRRRDRVIPTLFHTVHAPLFPGYVFVIPGSHWAPICNTLGVSRLLLSCGRPAPLRAAVISALRAGDDARAAPTPPHHAWRPGDACSASHGPLRDTPAAVVSLSPPTARIALMMFGAMREISVPLDCLRARD